MHFDGEFRHIGTIDPQPLVRAVESLGEDAWNEYVGRQERFVPHRQTQTVALLFDEDMRQTDPTAWPRLAEMESVLKPVLETISKANASVAGNGNEGYFIRIILTRMVPGTVITPHRDRGPAMMRSHRYHVAITTNERVEFGIGSQLRHFAPGEIWEINNRKVHAVQNLGDEARVHLILDYVVPGEEIHDPDGLVIA